MDPEEEPATEDSLDLSVGLDSKSQDPVRTYLREMASVSLLTREGEVIIAKRIERGLLVVMKAITPSPIVIKELISVGDDLRKGVCSIEKIVQFDEEELTEEKIANKTKQTLKLHRKNRGVLQNRTETSRKACQDPKVQKAAVLSS